VEDADSAPVAVEGPQIESTELSARVNAGFMQVLDRTASSCGCTSVAQGNLASAPALCAAVRIMRGLLDDEVRVATWGGELIIPGRRGHRSG